MRALAQRQAGVPTSAWRTATKRVAGGQSGTSAWRTVTSWWTDRYQRMAYGDQLVDRALPAHGVGRPAGGLIVTRAWSMATVRMERRYVRTCVVERTSVEGVRTGVLANWCTGDLQGHRKKLQPAETRYSTFVRELLAIYLAIKHFRHFIVGREFCVLTDHKPLTFDKYTPRQTRHLDFISQFTADIRHVHGYANPVADALSRATVGH